MNFTYFSRCGFSPASCIFAHISAKTLPSNNLKVISRSFVRIPGNVTKLNNEYLNVSCRLNKVKVCNVSSFVQKRDMSSEITRRYFASDGQLMKKKIHKKRYTSDVDPTLFEEGRYSVVAFATAKEYDLESLKIALMEQKLYKPQKLGDHEAPDVLLTVANYKVGTEPRHMFFFREGSVVLWNCTDLETSNVLAFLKTFEEESYPEAMVIREKENMSYAYQSDGKKCRLQGSIFQLNPEPENVLEKYTFSNAMAQSVKLGIWEATLDVYADSIADVTDDLQRGKPIVMSRGEVLRKTGALFSLRHHINLESDLLDTPDFYWEQAELEKLYLETVGYFSINKRTRILNEKLSHCAESVELVAAQLSDHHHVRLEWMIIILIMVEVGFEILHFLDRYIGSRFIEKIPEE